MISDTFRRWKHARRIARAEAEIMARSGEGAPHGLPAPLIVSLTSFAARFANLHFVLRSLMLQSVRPDRVILWLDEGDTAKLTPEIRASGVEVLTCPNWRSYKKIVPSLQLAPNAFIATADDDVYYRPDWLAGLVAPARVGSQVTCHRAHRVAVADGLPRHYADWEWNISAPEQGPLIFPTGVGGVLYAPGVFHADVTDAGKFQRLAPSADDIWLYWMHRLNGSRPNKIGGKFRVIEWPGSQEQTLRSTNLGGAGNDRALAAMVSAYGWPD